MIDDAGDYPIDEPIPFLLTGKRRPCTPEQHEIIKASRATFRAFTRSIGRQDNGVGGWMDGGNCINCGSTLWLCRKCGTGADGCVCLRELEAALDTIEAERRT